MDSGPQPHCMAQLECQEIYDLRARNQIFRRHLDYKNAANCLHVYAPTTSQQDTIHDEIPSLNITPTSILGYKWARLCATHIPADSVHLLFRGNRRISILRQRILNTSWMGDYAHLLHDNAISFHKHDEILLRDHVIGLAHKGHDALHLRRPISDKQKWKEVNSICHAGSSASPGGIDQKHLRKIKTVMPSLYWEVVTLAHIHHPKQSSVP